MGTLERRALTLLERDAFGRNFPKIVGFVNRERPRLRLDGSLSC